MMRATVAAAALAAAASLTACSSGASSYPHAWCSAYLNGSPTDTWLIKQGAPATLVKAEAAGLWWAHHGQSVIDSQQSFQQQLSATRKAAAETKTGLASTRELGRMCGR